MTLVTLRETYIKVNGIRLHAMMQGERGPLVVLLHGFPECWYSWRQYLPLLAEAGYRAVAPDLRGYNLSDKPRGIINYQTPILARDVYELIQALGEEQAIVVGHDWGGAIAWYLAMYYPQAVHKLVVCNLPHPAKYAEGIRTWRQLRKSWYIFAFQLPWLPEYLLARNHADAIGRMLYASAVQKTAFSPAELAKYREAISRPGALHAALNYYRQLIRRGPRPYRSRTLRVDAPTLLIWGEQDIALGIELTHDLDEWIPNLQIQYLPDSGHWVQQERPEQVNRFLLDFLAAGQTP